MFFFFCFLPFLGGSLSYALFWHNPSLPQLAAFSSSLSVRCCSVVPRKELPFSLPSLLSFYLSHVLSASLCLALSLRVGSFFPSAEFSQLAKTMRLMGFLSRRISIFQKYGSPDFALGFKHVAKNVKDTWTFLLL